MNAVAVFLGAKNAENARYRQAVMALVDAFSAYKLALIYGGSNTGLMKVLADNAIAQGVNVTGVYVDVLAKHESPHEKLHQLYVVDSMHQRKSKMAQLADGFIAFPGGIGTLEEFFEVYTWARLGLHHKPVGILNVDGYFDALLAFLDHSVEEGFLDTPSREILIVESDPKLLLQRMINT
ncbi:TIGR00730 family Rossman fold protein [Glaciecola sp. 1036]|uniref:LOG family protein n=1 Tax=Alteromonadaceae TaxID=72275 RepID=UPI003D03D694